MCRERYTHIHMCVYIYAHYVCVYVYTYNDIARVGSSRPDPSIHERLKAVSPYRPDLNSIDHYNVTNNTKQ